MEIKKEDMSWNFVYAVQFTTGSSEKHRGIVMTNAAGKVWRTWNVAEREQWIEKEVHLTKSHHVYEATAMEEQFAHMALDAQVQRGHNQKLLKQCKLMKKQLIYFNTDKLHHMAERINKLFGRSKA